MNTFQELRYGISGIAGVYNDIRKEAMASSHSLYKSFFPSRYAQGGGMAAAMFAPTGREAFLTPWRRQYKFGSEKHIRNLQRMLAENPDNERIQKALIKARIGSPKLKALGRVAKVGMGAAFIGLPAFITPGGLDEKGRAIISGAASMPGWTLGGIVGASIGGAIGSILGPAGMAIGSLAGRALGALAGAYGFDEAAQGIMKVSDRLVERERSRRKLDWIGDKKAFQTQRASTMRQQSMEMMNRGMMSARSMLGREGVMLHQ